MTSFLSPQLVLKITYKGCYRTTFSSRNTVILTCNNAALAAIADPRLAEQADISIAGLLHCDISSRSELLQYIRVRIDSILNNSLQYIQK